MNRLAAGMVVAALAATLVGAQRGGQESAKRVIATSKGVARTYVERTLEGFTIRVDERLLAADSATGHAALALLQAKLFDIGRAVRAPALAELQRIPLWLSQDDPCAPCACYHESAEWLGQNGYDPQKARAVELCNAANFLTWTHEQPWMVLHELAHGYQDRVLSQEPARIAELRRLHAAAKAGGKYESVLHWDGAKTRHYALNNDQEYFAEGTESWLGVNDFEPFVAAELRAFDPGLAKFLGEVWGEPVTSARGK